MFKTWTQAKDDINNWIEFSNVSVSPWWFTQLEQKYLPTGEPTRFGPKYSTAIVDCLFYDIDCLDENGQLIYKNYKGMLNMWRYAQKHDIKRNIAVTGGGYQLTLGGRVKPDNYQDAVFHIAERTNTVIDPNVSLSDMRRVVGSYNLGKESKGIRNTFCISLTDEEVEMDYLDHLKLSFKQRKGINRYGVNDLKFPDKLKKRKKLRELVPRSDFTHCAGVDEILENYGYDYEDLCSQMRAIIEQPRVGHSERTHIIKYLKSIVGIKYGDMLILLPKLLSARHGTTTDGGHSVEEGQVYSTYAKNHQFDPFYMRDEGYCPPECTDCRDYLYMLRNL